MADEQETVLENDLNSASDNGVIDDSSSVIMTIQDMEVDPSLIMELTMVFMEEQIALVDGPIFTLVTCDSTIVRQVLIRDYLATVFEPILMK